MPGLAKNMTRRAAFAALLVSNWLPFKNNEFTQHVVDDDDHHVGGELDNGVAVEDNAGGEPDGGGAEVKQIHEKPQNAQLQP